MITFLSNYFDKEDLRLTMKADTRSKADFIMATFTTVLDRLGEQVESNAITEVQFFERSMQVYTYMFLCTMAYQKKNPLPIQSLYYYNYIMFMSLSFPGLSGFQILCEDCCEACNAEHKKRLTLVEALTHAMHTKDRCQRKYNRPSNIQYSPIFPDDPNATVSSMSISH
jgi:hypothetical protein